MSSRRRKPSMRAIEALTSTQGPSSPPAASSSSTQQQQNRPAGQTMAMDQEHLYCVCLGRDDGVEPMIECSFCNNWFHFRCIGLTQQEALEIESYCCDICEQMGYGKSVYNTSARRAEEPVVLAKTANNPASPASKSKGKKKAAFSSDLPHVAASDSDSSMQDDDGDNSDDSFEHSLSPASGGPISSASFFGAASTLPHHQDHQQAQPQPKKKRKRRYDPEDSDVEDLGEDEDDEEYRGDEYDGDAGAVPKRKRREKESRSKAAAVQRKPSASSQRESSAPKARAPPKAAAGGMHPTRKHCITQLSQIFSSIFAASSSSSAVPDDTDLVETKAKIYAEAVEAEIFASFGEGTATPGQKYLTKFRSLHYNLKSNASFRSRIAASAAAALTGAALAEEDKLTPEKIVHATAEDLMTPEQRALAEDVRAQSLKQSVKEVTKAPTVKYTHKGEEEIESAAASENRREELEAARKAAAAAAEANKNKDQDGKEDGPLSERDLIEFGREEAFARAKQQREREQRARSMSVSVGPGGSGPQASPRLSSSTSGAFGHHDSPAAADEGAGSPVHRQHHQPTTTEVGQGIDISAADLGMDEVVGSSSELAPAAAAAPATGRQRSESVHGRVGGRASLGGAGGGAFDVASLWGKVAKSSPSIAQTEAFASAADVSMEVEGEAKVTAGELQDDYDPFETTKRAGAGEDDYDDILNDAAPGPTKPKSALKTPAQLAQQQLAALAAGAVPASGPVPLDRLEPVWAGDVIVPEEGGFPGFAVQVGGRRVGLAPQIWNQILPKGLTTEGRLPTSVASNYLVECSFATTREIILVALMPDTTGPTPQFPDKPTGERCIAKHAHLVDTFSKRDRVGAIITPKEMKHLVKDLYLIPLKKGVALPEYIDLLDEHVLSETLPRDRDLLLAAAVLQKGIIPMWTPPIVAPSAKQQPTPRSTTPPYEPPAAQQYQTTDVGRLSSLLANPAAVESAVADNPPALQDLLANPNLLQALANAPATSALLQSLNGGNNLASHQHQHASTPPPAAAYTSWSPPPQHQQQFNQQPPTHHQQQYHHGPPPQNQWQGPGGGGPGGPPPHLPTGPRQGVHPSRAGMVPPMGPGGGPGMRGGMMQGGGPPMRGGMHQGGPGHGPGMMHGPGPMMHGGPGPMMQHGPPGMHQGPPGMMPGGPGGMMHQQGFNQGGPPMRGGFGGPRGGGRGRGGFY